MTYPSLSQQLEIMIEFLPRRLVLLAIIASGYYSSCDIIRVTGIWIHLELESELYTWYKAVQGGMYWYEPVRTLLDTVAWPYEKPQNGTYQSSGRLRYMISYMIS